MNRSQENGVTVNDLSAAQRGMLLSAAERPPENRKGRENNYTWVGKGQAQTAKKLQALGLGAYVSDGYSARFWIWSRGYEVAAEAGVYPRGES